MSVAFGLNRLDMTSVAGFAASAQRAEAAGWRYGFIPSSPLLARDPYVMIANALAQTQSITLGPLIENPVTRHPAVIAGSVATLAELAPGRVMAGLGVGDTAVRLIGRTPAKIATLERATTMIRTLLAKGQVEVGAAAPARLRHAAAAPVWIAAQGPKTLRMAGRVADGVFVRVGASPRGISAAISQVHQGADEAGRDPADVAIGLVLHTVMCEDLDRAAVVGRAVTAGYYEYSPMLFDAVRLKWDGPDVETLKARVWPDFHHAADMFAAGKLVDFLPRAAVDAFCLWGDRAQIRQQLGNVLEQFPSVQIVVPHPVPPYRFGDGPDIDYLDWFASNVMPAFRD